METSHPPGIPPSPPSGADIAPRGLRAGQGAGTHLQRTFLDAEPIFVPNLSDVEQEGSFRAILSVMGTLCDKCPQAAPALSQRRGRAAPLPALPSHNLSHNENFNDSALRLFPRAFAPPQHPVLARGHPAAQPGYPETPPYPKTRLSPHRHTPGQLQATVAARPPTTAPPPFVTESVSLVPVPLALRPRQTAHCDPTAEPRAAFVPFQTVKPCYILSHVIFSAASDSMVGRDAGGPGSAAEPGSRAKNHMRLFLSKKIELQ